MTPYYQDDYVTLYYGDCLEITDWLEADVLVTDPPYGIGWYGTNHKTAEKHAGIQNDQDTAARDTVLSMWGRKPGAVFGSPVVPPPTGTKQALAYVKPPDSGIFGCINGWRRDWEAIYLTGEWPITGAARSGVLKTNAPSLVSVTAARYPNDTGAGHPHAKPQDIMESIVSACPPGVIADPFAGSGATLAAARNLGRKAIGVELEEKYCEIIANRLSQGAFDFA